MKKKIICYLFFLSLISTAYAQSLPKYSVFLNHQYSKSYFSQPSFFNDDPIQGTYSWGLDGHYHFRRTNNKNILSLGIAITRIGHGNNNIWEDSTPEFEEIYGEFPIQRINREFVYYFSFPTTFHFKISNNLFISPNIAFEYPLAVGDFSKYTSTDGRISKEKIHFDILAFYPALFSLGTGVQIGWHIPINEKYTFVFGGKLQLYSLLAFRAHDDFRIGRKEYPYSLGIQTGISF